MARRNEKDPEEPDRWDAGCEPHPVLITNATDRLLPRRSGRGRGAWACQLQVGSGLIPPKSEAPPPAAMDPSPTVCYSANDTSNGASNGAIGARKVTEVPASPEITQTAGILGGIQAQDGTPDGPPLSRSPSQEAGVERWRDGSTHSTSRVQRAGSGGG
eukprot:CAMPEP_0169478144 /NCGR_PEP_ID=MMETSP1042-20121227/28314_1 /TAXON_ID=464988 /ORGANISM="Hemiselmis andersenii, Strain CCMP1180" /LENGTH=158 /DNA_ID=CAMNT_0009592583 /DNA_START=597 /DNA_END=1069 /DNA_ORIENTATION=+